MTELDIQRLCKELDISPFKGLGQNFLVDETVLGDIIKVADLRKEDTVLEIGPGFGALTEELVKRAGKVIAIEKDNRLYEYLKDRFNGEDHLDLIEGDFLVWFKGFADYRVVANLPYSITSRVLRVLLESENRPKSILVMVQKEVADRMCAKNGDMSVLSVMCQYYGSLKIVREVGKNSFWPVPKVDSAVVFIEVNQRERNDVFFRVVRIGFSSKRKMLKNNFASVYGKEESEKLIIDLGLNLKVRAEDLGVEDWIRLAEKLKKID